jgi:predicted membrane-bound spermidine synthase
VRPTTDPTTRVAGERAISLVFFGSGAASLIFEVVWLHRCGIVFGNSVWATSVVLSSFMAGLDLGNAFIAYGGHRIRRFVRTYAALEAVVAISGVATTLLLPALAGVFVPLARQFVEVPWLVNLTRLTMAFAALMVPTTAMGATLPVLVGAVSRSQHAFAHALGRLYGWNTLGAVVGVVGTEVVLIARFGVTGSACIAGLLDLGVAAYALRLSRRADDTGNLDQSPGIEQPSRPFAVWRLSMSTALAGAALMALEVVWFRFLMMFVIPTTLVVSLMLAVVLASIAIGGLATSIWAKRREDALAYLPVVAVVASSMVVASYTTFRFLTQGAQLTEWYWTIWLTSALTLPTALLSGVLFTLLGAAFKREIAMPARAAGWLALSNTAGAMCGPLIAAFVLLPFLGVERSLWVLATLYAVVGVLTLRHALSGARTVRALVFAAAALVAATLLVRFPFGLMQTSYVARAASAYLGDGSKMIATSEEPSETIFLTEKSWMGKPMYHRLVTNGFSMTGTSLKAKRYMRYFVYWPMLLHETPLRRVLLICYGVGITADAIKSLKSVESVDVVEISRDVVAMSDRIYSESAHPLHDPRVRLHLEDGRYYLQTTTARFDLITGEPPPPGTPGTVNLYTREYFQLSRGRRR